MSVGAGVLEELSSALDRLVAADPATLGDGETVVALHRELERLTAATTRAVAAFDAAGAGAQDDRGAHSAASWLTSGFLSNGRDSLARMDGRFADRVCRMTADRSKAVRLER